MNVLGINAFHGDSSAALLGAQLIAAVEEERLNRQKHWAGLPVQAARQVLNGTQPDHIAISRNPQAHLWRKLFQLTTTPGRWRKAVRRAQNSRMVAGFDQSLAEAGIHVPASHVHNVEHHRAHLASAFYCSPFEEAAVISIDGFGDYSSVMWGIGRGNHLEVKGSVQFPHSLGLFYTAFTQYLGFPKYGDEYKMMGLSAYGEPRFANKVRDVVRSEGDQVRLNLSYFTHHSKGVEMNWDACEPVIGSVYSEKMTEVFGPARPYNSEYEQRHCDLAASVQTVLEDNYLALLNFVQKQTGLRTVCLAGGVALNCVANGMIFERTDFRDVYIQPAAHDAGTSIGAALHVRHQVLNLPREFVMNHVYYGPGYSDTDVRAALDEIGCSYAAVDSSDLVRRIARDAASGKVIGWFQGRMEFGPRALGNRSIIADPRRTEMKDTLNSRIKMREFFRPFCPSVLAEHSGEFFENSYASPFMVMAYKIKPEKRSVLAAVTHEDGTGRLQTVDRETNPLYWRLIREFGDLTGVPVLLNTSFNENEPIVNTPGEAIECFLRTKMDVLAIGNFIALKSENQRLCETRKAFGEAQLAQATAVASS